MAALPVRFCAAVRSYWPRWGYQRLKNSDTDKNLRVAGRPARGGRLQRPIRLRRVSRIRTIMSSPIRLLARLRNAYVGSVIRLLGKGSGLSAPIGPSESLLNRRIPKARPAKFEPMYFERRLMLEVSHSMRASGEIDVAVKCRKDQSAPL